jgi:hypothetical protein
MSNQDLSLVGGKPINEFFAGNQIDPQTFDPLSFWLEFRTETHEDYLSFYVPILCMSYGGSIDDYGHSHRSDADSLILAEESSCNSRVVLADLIIRTLRESYFRSSYRYSIPRRVFNFSEESRRWLEIDHGFEPSTFYFESWGIRIACVLKNENFSCLLRQEGFVVAELPIYSNGAFHE